MPTLEEQAGLTNDLFVAFYEDILYGQTGGFWWNIRDSNVNGFIIGTVHGPNSIDTQYIFRAGQLYCCMEDSPFQIQDVNDSDVFVGSNGPPGLAYVGSAGGPNRPNSSALTPSNIGDFYGAQFYAIDNSGRIWGEGTVGSSLDGPPDGVGYFMLTPGSPTPVPEPATLVLLAGPLLCGFLYACCRPARAARRTAIR
jgi:hypothetical protein